MRWGESESDGGLLSPQEVLRAAFLPCPYFPLYFCSHWPSVRSPTPTYQSGSHRNRLTSCILVLLGPRGGSRFGKWPHIADVVTSNPQQTVILALVLEHVTLCLKGYVKGDAWPAFKTVEDLLYFLSLQNILNSLTNVQIWCHVFSSLISVTTPHPRYLFNWSVTTQCYWHPWWECGTRWDCSCQNKRGWTAALNLSVIGPELLSLSTSRVCPRGRSLVQCLLLTFDFFLYVKLGE